MTFNDMWAIIFFVKYKDWRPSLTSDGENIDFFWTFNAPDWTKTDLPVVEWNSRKYRMSPYMTESEVVQTVFMAAMQAEEHETREAFSYEGKHLFNPHIAVRALMGVCETLEVRQ